MLFVGTSIIHPSTEGVFLLCNILDLLIYSLKDNIKAFYLGAKINEKEKSEIIEFAKKNNRIVYQMILSANTYELRAERIDNV